MVPRPVLPLCHGYRGDTEFWTLSHQIFQSPCLTGITVQVRFIASTNITSAVRTLPVQVALPWERCFGQLEFKPKFQFSLLNSCSFSVNWCLCIIFSPLLLLLFFPPPLFPPFPLTFPYSAASIFPRSLLRSVSHSSFTVLRIYNRVGCSLVFRTASLPAVNLLQCINTCSGVSTSWPQSHRALVRLLILSR